MKRASLWITMCLAAAFVAGCSGAAKDDSRAQAESSPETESHDSDVAARPGMVEAPDAATATVSLAGNLGCAHCTFHVKNSCSLGMKAADGTVYLIEAGDEQEALMDVRYDEPAVLVAGRVSEVDGQKIIYADTVEMR